MAGGQKGKSQVATAKGKKGPAGEKQRSGSRKATANNGADQVKELWQCRMYKSREWGHKLHQQGGSHQASTKKLLETLKDGRVLSEQSLRRTALQALTPAASVGHRGALEAQANALMDRSKVVRECALDSLWEAAGGKRPEEGGAVHAMLAEVLPPRDARYRVESRRAGADALMRLAPKGDTRLLSTATKWLDDEDADVRCSATQAAGLLGEGLGDVQAVTMRLQDGNWKVARAAVEALEHLSGGSALRHRCKPRKPLPESEVGLGDSQLSAREATPGMSMSQSLPSVLPADVPETDTLASTFPQASATSSSTTGGRRRSIGKGRRRSSVKIDVTQLQAEAVEEESDDPGDPDGIPRPSEAHLAATAALAETCSAEGDLASKLLLGLPRADAVASLRRMAPWGDLPALEGAAARLRDTDSEVRREAVAAVTALAPGDQQEATKLSAHGLRELDWRARASAVEALAACAEQNSDGSAFELAAACLEGPDWGHRRGAVAALRVLSSCGQGENVAMALEAVNAKLDHEHWSVRRKAVVAIASISETVGGDATGLKMLKDMMHDPDEEVRLAVADALPRTATFKNKEAVQYALHMAADDPETEVRLRALSVLEQLCSAERSRTRQAVKDIALLFADENEEVRLAAQRVMRSIGAGRRTAIDALAEMLKHPDEKARLLAADTFTGVAEARQDRATKRTSKLLRNSQEGVREAAAKAMAAFDERQDPAVIAAGAAVAMRWRRARFTTLRGNALSYAERMQNYQDRGEDPEKDVEFLKLFGPPSGEPKAKKGSKSLKGRKHKHGKARSEASSSALTSRAASEAGDSTIPESDLESTAEHETEEEVEADSDEEFDDTASRTSMRSAGTTASKQSRTSQGTSLSKQSKGASSKSSMTSGMQLRGKAAEEFKRMKAEAEKEEKRLAAERKRRIREMQAAMGSSDEEDLSESGTEVELEDGTFASVRPGESPQSRRMSRRRSSIGPGRQISVSIQAPRGRLESF